MANIKHTAYRIENDEKFAHFMNHFIETNCYKKHNCSSFASQLVGRIAIMNY